MVETPASRTLTPQYMERSNSARTVTDRQSKGRSAFGASASSGQPSTAFPRPPTRPGAGRAGQRAIDKLPAQRGGLALSWPRGPKNMYQKGVAASTDDLGSNERRTDLSPRRIT